MNTDIHFETLKRKGFIYFVRHGESESNRKNIMQGRANSNLSECGIAQAHRAGELLAARFNAAHAVQEQSTAQSTEPQNIMLYCSPLDRAIQTAQAINTSLRLADAPLIDERLIEIDLGIFSGLTAEDAQRRYPKIWDQFQAASWEGVTDAEPITSLVSRTVEYWNSLIDHINQGADHIVNVSHGGIMQWFFRVTYGSLTNWMPLINSPNGWIICYEVRPSNVPLSTSPLYGTANYFGQWHFLTP